MLFPTCQVSTIHTYCIKGFHINALNVFHMLQSRVEIEHYSIAYFDTLLRLKRCSSELPLRAELIPATYTYQVFMSLGCAYEPPPLMESPGL